MEFRCGYVQNEVDHFEKLIRVITRVTVRSESPYHEAARP